MAETQVVCVGQPMLIADDFNADPAVIPCLAKGISAGRFVDLALAFSRGAGTALDASCRFSLEGCAGSRRNFLVGCPSALAACDACFATDRWFTPHFRYLHALVLMLGWVMLLARRCVNLSALLIGWILLIGPPRRLLVLSRMFGKSTGRSLLLFQMRLYWLLGMRSPGLLLIVDFWLAWSRHAEAGQFLGLFQGWWSH